MFQSLVATLVDYPTLTLFVVIGLGYLIGEIEIRGFRLGVAGVLFVGLAVGSLSPDLALPEVLPALGLIIFVYAVGIHSGPVFFESFRRQGYRNSLLTVGVLVFGAGVAMALGYSMKLGGGRTVGLYCGALTNTPALAAARERIRDAGKQDGLPAEQLRQAADQPVVAYSIAYPLGILGVLLSFHVARKFLKMEVPPPEEPPEIKTRNFAVRNPGIIGKKVKEVLGLHRDIGFVISRIRHEQRIDLAKSDTVLNEGDVIVVVGDDRALGRAQQIFGAASEGQIELDRTELDYQRVHVSSKEVVGKRIRELDLQNRLSAIVTRVRRGDIDIVPDGNTRLELGDWARVLTRRENIPNVQKFFGDSIRRAAETDFASISIGMVLGVLVGLAPIPLPGGTVVRLGLAGGPLLVALVLGKLEHSGRITWVLPPSTNLTLRQIGLLFFLAGVGVRAGYSFFDTLTTSGVQLLAAGAGVTFGVTLATLIVGHKFMKIPFDALMGLMSGVQTQPACLAYANSQTKSDAPNVAYASVYPAATIAKIVVAQLLAMWR